MLPQKQVMASLSEKTGLNMYSFRRTNVLQRSLAKKSVLGAGEMDLWTTNTSSDISELGLEFQSTFAFLLNFFGRS